MRTPYFTFIYFLILISGCTKDTPLGPCQQLLMNGNAESSELFGTWELRSFSFIDTKGRAAILNVPFEGITISFLQKNDCDINGPCNIIGGTKYGTSGNNSLDLDFGEAGVTLIYCIAEERRKLEEVYFDALHATQCYAIDESGQLKIHFENDNPNNVMTFSRY